MKLPTAPRLSPIAGAIILVAHACAQAQATAPAAPAAAASGAATTTTQGVHALSTVVISGPRANGYSPNVVGIGAFRDQSPVDVPLTNNVITRSVLDAQGAINVLEAARNTAGVSQSQVGSATYSSLVIRGIVLDPTASYRMDGSLPLIAVTSIPLEDKERVEVLKGASSIYYGMVPPAGIVNFEMKRAGSKPVTSFATMVNQYGGWDVSGDVGRRFGDEDRFGLRVNLLTGKEEVGFHNYGGRRELASAAFDYRILPNLTFKADLEHTSKNVTDQALIQLIGTATELPKLPAARTNPGAGWAKSDNIANNQLYRLDWQINDNWGVVADFGEARAFRSRSLSTFSFLHQSGDSTTAPAAYATGAGGISGNFARGGTYENQNSRVDLNGRLETGPIAHEVTLGFTRNTRLQNTPVSGAGAQYGCNPTATPSCPTSTPATPLVAFIPQNLLNPTTLALIGPTGPNSPTRTWIRDIGEYFVDRVLITKEWQAMIGIRHTGYSSGQSDPYLASKAYRTSANSPNYSLIYKPMPNASIYASRLKGLEAGAPVGATFSNANSLLPAAVSVQNELGAKYQLAGGTLIQAAFFDIKRAQTTTSIAPAGSPAPPNPQPMPYYIQTLAGEAEYKGFEATITGELNRNIAIIVSGMLLDAKVISDPSPPATNLLGKIPGNTPKHTLSVSGEYRFDAIPGFSMNAGAYYTGRVPGSNSNLVFMPAYVLASLGGRYLTHVRGIATTYQVNVDNLFNKTYWASGDASNANPYTSLGLPRMIRATAKFDF